MLKCKTNEIPQRWSRTFSPRLMSRCCVILFVTIVYNDLLVCLNGASIRRHCRHSLSGITMHLISYESLEETEKLTYEIIRTAILQSQNTTNWIFFTGKINFKVIYNE